MSTPRDKLDEIWDSLPIGGGSDPLDSIWDTLPGPASNNPSPMAQDASGNALSRLRSPAPGQPAKKQPIRAALRWLARKGTFDTADEIVGAVEGAVSPNMTWREGIARQKGLDTELAEENPGAANLGKIAGTVATIPMTGGMGVVRGAALSGGLTAAGSTEGGPGTRLAAGAIGTAFGAGLGYGADKLFRLAPRTALTAGGAALGATYGDSNAEHLGGAAAGAAIAAGGANVGGTLARKGLSLLKPGGKAQVMDDAGFSKVAEALADEGKTVDDILNFPGGEGDIIADLGKKRGPIQRLGETVVTYPTKGAERLESTALARSAFSPPAAEKAARKALGSNFRPRNEVALKHKANIRKETAPAYKELAGEEVSIEKLAQLMRDEPAVADMWKRAQENAARRVKRGFDDAEELPDLFKTGEDGSLEFVRETVPVRGLDMIKRALREQVERTRNSLNPFTQEDAAIIGKGLDDVMEAAKIESPKYAETLRKFGEASQKEVGKMSQRKQLSDFIAGNSRTAARQQGQESFEAEGFNLNALDPRQWLSKAMQSSTGKFLAGWNKELADATATALTTDISTPAARQAVADRLRAQGIREEEIRRVLSALPRIAATGSGLGIGALARERKP